MAAFHQSEAKVPGLGAEHIVVLIHVDCMQAMQVAMHLVLKTFCETHFPIG